MIVLGIDPGIARTAWALLHYDAQLDRVPKLLKLDQCKTTAAEDIERMLEITHHFRKSIATWPMHSAEIYIEKFTVIPPRKGQKSPPPLNAARIGMVIGSALATLMQHMPICNSIHLVVGATWRTRILGAANLQCRLEHLEGIIDLGEHKVRNQDQRDAIAVGYYGLMKEDVL